MATESDGRTTDERLDDIEAQLDRIEQKLDEALGASSDGTTSGVEDADSLMGTEQHSKMSTGEDDQSADDGSAHDNM